MASRANKYASLNFNDIYEKKVTTNHKQHPHPSSSSSSSPSPSSSKPILSNSRIHGNMLVLSRPSPKPISQHSTPPSQSQPPPPPQHRPQQPPAVSDQTQSESDAISLRPQGRTGSGPSLAPSSLTLPKLDKDFSSSPSPSPSPKPNRFVPPHLRPGFVGREEKPGPEFQTQQVARSREFGGHRQGNFGSPNRYGEDGRPKSGGGYESMRGVDDSDRGDMNRPGSSGARPSSSG